MSEAEQVKQEAEDFLKTLQEDYEKADKTINEFKTQLHDPYLQVQQKKDLKNTIKELREFQNATYERALKVQDILKQL
jgi:chromosome segregation ATPase